MAYTFVFNPITCQLDFVTPADTKELLVSAADTTENYLSSKLTSNDSSISYLILNAGANEVLNLVVNQNVIDHGNLSGLGDDDHSQYAFLQGRGATQTLSGGNAVGATLRLQSNQAMPQTENIEIGSRLIPYGKHASLTNQNIKYTSKLGGIIGNSYAIQLFFGGPTGTNICNLIGGVMIQGVVYGNSTSATFYAALIANSAIMNVFDITLLSNGVIGATSYLPLSGGLPTTELGKQKTDQWANIWTDSVQSDGPGGLNIVTVNGPIYCSAATSVITDVTVDWTTSVIGGNATLTTYTGNIGLTSAVDVNIGATAGEVNITPFNDFNLTSSGGSIYLNALAGGLSVSCGTTIGIVNTGPLTSFDTSTSGATHFLSKLETAFVSDQEYVFSNVANRPINLWDAPYDPYGPDHKISLYVPIGMVLDHTITLPPAFPTASGQPIIASSSGDWTYLAPSAVNLVPYFDSSAALTTNINFTYDAATLTAPDFAAAGMTGNIITSTSIKTSIQELDDSLYMLENTGFHGWTSGTDASTWSITGNKFKVLRSGYGYIRGKKVSWLANVESGLLTANACTYVYIDSTGAIGTTTSRTDALFHNNIALFEVLYDGTIYKVVKENHEYSENTDLSIYLHWNAGTVIRGTGAVITRVTTGGGGVITDRELKIVGQDYVDDHGVETLIPDSAGSAVSWYVDYKNASGKWIRYVQQPNFPMEYNLAGTPTALTSNRYGIFRLYASKDNINSAGPTYVAVMHNAEYTSSAAALTAINNGLAVIADNELAEIEMAQLGYIIVQNSGGGNINTVIVAKSTFNKTFLGGATASSHLLLSDLNTGDSGHPQFALLAGRTSGQHLYGGINASENLLLESTSDSTKGEVQSACNFAVLGGCELRLKNAANTFYTGFKSGNASANKVWTLPLVDGTAGQALTTNGSATLSWANAGRKAIVAKTGIATLSDAEYCNTIVTLDGSSAVVPITLPTPSAVNSGYICKLCCINAVCACTITNTIGGVVGYAFSGINDFVNVWNDGSNYYFG